MNRILLILILAANLINTASITDQPLFEADLSVSFHSGGSFSVSGTMPCIGMNNGNTFNAGDTALNLEGEEVYLPRMAKASEICSAAVTIELDILIDDPATSLLGLFCWGRFNRGVRLFARKSENDYYLQLQAGGYMAPVFLLSDPVIAPNTFVTVRAAIDEVQQKMKLWVDGTQVASYSGSTLFQLNGFSFSRIFLGCVEGGNLTDDGNLFVQGKLRGVRVWSGYYE